MFPLVHDDFNVLLLWFWCFVFITLDVKHSHSVHDGKNKRAHTIFDSLCLVDVCGFIKV